MLSMDLGELWRSLKRKFFVCGGVAKGKTIRVVHDHGGFRRPCPGISRDLKRPKCSRYHMS